jgi:hypothetical protein
MNVDAIERLLNRHADHGAVPIAQQGGALVEIIRHPVFFDVMRNDSGQPVRLVPVYSAEGLVGRRQRPTLRPVTDAKGLIARIEVEYGN